MLWKLGYGTFLLEFLNLIFRHSSFSYVSLYEVLGFSRLSLRQTRGHWRVDLLDVLSAVHEVVLLSVKSVLLILRQRCAVGVQVLIVLHHHLPVLLSDF